MLTFAPLTHHFFPRFTLLFFVFFNDCLPFFITFGQPVFYVVKFLLQVSKGVAYALYQVFHMIRGLFNWVIQSTISPSKK
jgi:hypothetical protein